MRLLGRCQLNSLKKQGKQADTWLSVWQAEVLGAHWFERRDVVEQFPSVSELGGDLFQFSVEPAETYAINVFVGFQRQIVLIKKVVRIESRAKTKGY